MRSKNKPAPTRVEGDYIRWVKEQACVICDASAPSDCHEANQGQWFTSIPLCKDCHQGPRNGIHGEKRMWILTKMDEWSAVNETVRRFVTQFMR